MVKRYRSGWWLDQKYHEEGWTQAEIAEECEVSPRTIRKWMKRRGIEARELIGENHPLHGEERAEKTKRAISAAMEGREVPDEHRQRLREANIGRTLSQTTREKISEALTGIERSASTRRRMSESTSDEANPNWRGGYSRRYGPGWSAARRRVHERDGVCQNCGHDGSKRRLEVHHIIPVRRFRESSDAELADAHDLRNLVLLCRRCHPRADHGLLGFESGVDVPE